MTSEKEILDNGDAIWHKIGTHITHREDGPAIEYLNGTKAWCLCGQLHRLDGPAIEYYNGHKAWYYEGKFLECDSQETFERLLKLKAFW